MTPARETDLPQIQALLAAGGLPASDLDAKSLATFMVLRDGAEVRLTPIEFALLEVLARAAGRPLTFLQLITRVWSSPEGATRDALRVHLSSLRRKLEPDAASPRYIVSEPCVGYRFIAEPS